jgi:hypothetical protein
MKLKKIVIGSLILTTLFSACASDDTTTNSSDTDSSSFTSDQQIVLDGNSDSSGYVLKSTTSTLISTASSTQADPTLTFTIGKRYQITVNNQVAHPILLLDDGGNTLLGMDVTATENAGSLESDSSINFKDDKEGTIAFTYTQELANQLKTYKCFRHAAMTGSIANKDTATTTATPDATLVFGNNGASDYTLTSVSNSAIATKDSNDPQLTFTEGKRYQITVTNHSAHPFQFIDSGSNVLLAMGSASGAFESDSDVNYNDDGAGTITFTYTTKLATELKKYRCQFHFSTMEGTIKNASATTATTTVETASITLSNVSFTDYKIDAASATTIATVGESDPTLNLKIGTRYTVTFPSSHPFSLKSSSTTLLGSTTGSFSTDSSVNVTTTSTTMEFTLTAALAAELTTYVCEHHSGMTGTITSSN